MLDDVYSGLASVPRITGIEPAFQGGDWFFTPAPFAYGLGEDDRWLMAGLAPRVDKLDFGHFDYRDGEGWGMALTYRGTLQVAGVWPSPDIVLLPADDAYRGLSAYSDWLGAADRLPGTAHSPEDWWRGPIWCGWGEQVAREGPHRARDLSSSRNYEHWLGVLARQGVVPATIVVDDR